MKNRKNIVNISKLISLLLIVSLVSCNLEIEESDSSITKESSGIFEGISADKVESSITTLFNDIQSQYQTQENYYATNVVSTDEQMVPTRGTDWGDNGIWRTLHTHSWDPTHQFILNLWNDKNAGVLKAAQILDPKSEPTPVQKAKAQFVRAYNMWLVLDNFGQVPYRNPSDGIDVIPEVKTRAEAYEMVIKDLRDAIPNLPAVGDDVGKVNSEKANINKAGGQLLLAKVLLNGFIYKGEAKPTDAELTEIITLVDAIEASGYALHGDKTKPDSYFELFVNSKTNSDVIWCVQANIDNKMWNTLHYNQPSALNGGGGWNGFTTLAEFYDLFDGDVTQANEDSDDKNEFGGPQEQRRGYVHTKASTNAENSGFGYGFQIGQMWGWDSDKKEPKQLFQRNGAPLIFTKELPGLVGNGEATGIRLLKYSPRDLETKGHAVFRFADAYLMRAEARFRKGEKAQALADINALRDLRRANPLTALEEIDILNERGRELYLEYWRRNDMIRFGQFTKKLDYKNPDAVDNNTKNLFPIPASALLSNPGLKQNPGY